MKTSKAKPGNSLRIIAGQWRSRKLQFPDVEGLRPTADRIRETLFNWLQEAIPRASCLDLFAGSGACGIEALSRGARHVCFVEKSPLAAAAIKQNLHLLGATQFQVVCEDSLTWLDRKGEASTERFDIVFVDPPFATDLLAPSASKLEASGLLHDNALLYVETARELDLALLPVNWQLRKSRRAGAVYFYLLQRELRQESSE